MDTSNGLYKRSDPERDKSGTAIWPPCRVVAFMLTFILASKRHVGIRTLRCGSFRAKFPFSQTLVGFVTLPREPNRKNSHNAHLQRGGISQFPK